MGFVHLHTHSEYSMLDSTIKIRSLIRQVNDFSMSAVALTDHGNLFGAYVFYEMAKRYNIKPIIGCELYVTHNIDPDYSAVGKTYHLTVLVMNKTGYQNLSRLVTKSHLKGFFNIPSVNYELLNAHNEGLIVLSGCINGELSQSILRNDIKAALEVAFYYRKVFGDRYYLEVQATGLPEQARVNKKLKEIGKKLGIQLVATNDCHYLRKADSKTHDVLLCIKTGAVIQDDNRFKFQSDQYYLKSEEEMMDNLKGFEDAINRTEEVAERCNFEFKHTSYKLPEFEVEEGKPPHEHLAGIARIKLDEKAHEGMISADRLDEYKERMEKELEIIRKMEFSNYFLVVADLINHVKTQGIPVGPGKGRVASSLVAFTLGITEVDPIPYDLIFERFLNPEWVRMPDFLFDICGERRDEVMKYLIEKYGSDKVAEIGTFKTMSSKVIVKHVGRVLGIPYADVDRISKLIPKFRGHDFSIDRALREVPEIKELVDNSPELQEMVGFARTLENLVEQNLVEHFSIDAGWIVIANEPLADHIPLCRGLKNEIVTQYDIDSVQEFGFLNLNLLGLKTLTIIDKTLKLIREKHGSENRDLIDIKKISLDDPSVYKLLSSGKTNGIFQVESPGMQEFLVKLQPSVFDDIIAALSLYRPGPLDSGMVDDFIKRKHGKEKIKFPLPDLQEILKDTYGLFVYQEQIMQTASVVANYSLGEADLLRRAMGKKKPEEMKAQRARFLKGAKEKNITDKKAKELFDTMEKFAEYSFNKSHSTAYALITYQTAFLKAYFPNEYSQALNSVTQFD